MSAKHTEYFANELYATCGRTVESGRRLPEFWARVCATAVSVFFIHYKFRRFSDLSLGAVVAQLTIPLGCCMGAASSAECQYTCACNALCDEFAAVNRRVARITAEFYHGTSAAETVCRVARDHCRLTRLVRLFNDEYGVPVLLVTLNLLLSQIYMMNDLVSVIVAPDAYHTEYVDYMCVYDTYEWLMFWFRFWWICYRVDGLVKQVSCKSSRGFFSR